LTIFVVSEVGTFYTNWTDRWADAGVPMRVSRNYLRSLQKVLGANTNSHSTAYRSAIPLSQVSHHLKPISSAVTVAIRSIKAAIKSVASKRIPDSLPTMACHEGVLTEVHLFRRTRSRRLRQAALVASRGMCATCGVDFSQVLGGRGKRVLQAHHRKQLADTDKPGLNTVDDIAILCANCHLLVHYDRQEALDVDDLKAMLDAEV
jgi:predicted HNH restriction endonuclease